MAIQTGTLESEGETAGLNRRDGDLVEFELCCFLSGGQAPRFLLLWKKKEGEKRYWLGAQDFLPFLLKLLGRIK